MPMNPAEITKLQQERARAQAWVDACEVDVLTAKTKLAQAQLEQENARARLAELASTCESALRQANHPVSCDER